MSSVLVTDGNQRSALAVVRSLGSAGYEVHVCAPRTPSLGGSSRFASTETLTPNPLEAPRAFARAVESIVESRHVDLAVPVTDASVTALLTPEGRSLAVPVPFPSYTRYAAVSDKGAVAAAAQTLGIRVPRQSIVANRDGPGSELPDGLRFPLVVKPVRSVVRDGGRLRKTGVTFAGSPDELSGILADLPEGAFPVLLQERIEGPGIGVFLLLWEGELIAAFAHRRLREKPPSGGVSVLRESISIPPELLARSRALLDQFDWQGVAMVEYKGEPADPALMEVNGRFWGSLQLAVDAGVDFPTLLVRAALGDPIQPVTGYEEGVRCRWFWGDVDHLLARMRHSDGALDLPAGSPGRMRALWDFARSFGPDARGEVLRWNDPLPAARETLDWFRRR